MASSTPDRGGENVVRDSLLAGVALLIPLVVTVAVVAFVLNFIAQALNPVVDGLNLFWPGEVPAIIIEVISIAVFVLLIFVVGFVAENTTSDRVAESFHDSMERIPGLGSVYTGFHRMSETLIESDINSFQEVKLVEFPTSDVYSIGFVTSHPPEYIGNTVGEQELRTVFMPLAPNPVMGGFLIYVPKAQLWNIDMTVEEAAQAIITSGVANTNEEA